MMQTERVTFLTTPENKAALSARAAARGVSIAEYIRRKVENDDGESDAEEAELAAIVEELIAAVPDMRTRLDRVSSMIEQAIAESDRRLQEAGVRR
jgi:hypothetical protein